MVVSNYTETIITKKPVQSQGKASQKEKDRQSISNKNNEKSKSTPQGNIVKWTILEISSKFIPMREWRLHLCAYYDHTRYSIWYGTKSYKWECITEEEALKRFQHAIQWRIDRVKSDYPTLLPHQQSALVSLFYNCNSCYLRVGKTVEKTDFNRSSAIVKKFPWLAKRARAEWDLYNWYMY